MGYPVLSKYRAELMGIAMLGVLLFHARLMEPRILLLERLFTVGFGGVDLFLLLSCMGLVCSLGRREQSYTQFMARRAGRILPAYFAVMVPFTLWDIFRGKAYLSTLVWNSTLMYYWTRPAGAFNWYVSGAMLFYAMTPFFFRRLHASRNRVRFTVTAVVLSLLISQILMRDGWWQYIDFYYRLPVFFLGLLIGFFVLEDRKLGKKDLFFWLCSLLVGGAYALFSAVTMYDFAPLAHAFLLTTIPLCLAVCFLFEKLPLGWLRKALRPLGKNSLEIYLLNVSLFSRTDFFLRLLPFPSANWLFYLILIATNILLGLLLHRLVDTVRAKAAKYTCTGALSLL